MLSCLFICLWCTVLSCLWSGSLVRASHWGSSGSIPIGFIVSEFELRNFFLRVSSGFLCHSSFHHCCTVICHRLRGACDTLIRQRSITSSVSKLGPSFLTQDLIGHRARELVVSEQHFVVWFRCVDFCIPLTNSAEQRPWGTNIYCPSQEFPHEVSLPRSLEAATGLYSNSNFNLKPWMLSGMGVKLGF